VDGLDFPRGAPLNSSLAIPFLSLSLSLAAAGSRVDALNLEGQWEPGQSGAFQAMLNKPAPELKLSRWALGEVTPAQMKGRIILADFWATWCAPCRQAFPHNSAIQEKYRSKGVLVVGACTGGREEGMEAVARASGGKYPTAVAAPDTAAAWNLGFFPTYAVIDRKGMLRAIGIKPDYVEKILDALLAEQPD